MTTLLVIDNYDSFTYNLVQMFLPYKMQVKVYRSDKIKIETVEQMDPDYILISPGPKDPSHAGISKELIQLFYQRRPILGVCLGMQCINEVFGGKTCRAPLPMHGKTSRVEHCRKGLFKGIPSPFLAARYHSLQVQLPVQHRQKGLRVTACSSDGVIMGLSHVSLPLYGVQFHPESFLTQGGVLLIENFLRAGPLKIDKSKHHTNPDALWVDHAPEFNDQIFCREKTNNHAAVSQNYRSAGYH